MRTTSGREQEDTRMTTSEALPLTAGAAEDKFYKRIYWRLVPLLIVCFIVAYYDRVNISFAKLQMQDELKFSDTVYGLGASFNSDRSGERKWHFAISAIASGVGYAVSAAFPHDFTIAVAGLALATLGILAIFPVFWTVPSTFLGGIAFINSIGNLGSIFSPTFNGWINDRTHSTQLAINAVAGMMVLAGLLILVFWPGEETPKS
jgi:hypothetical protein